MTQTEADPFAASITIASAVNIVFRRNYLQPKTIAIIPAQGYRKHDMQSAAAQVVEVDRARA